MPRSKMVRKKSSMLKKGRNTMRATSASLENVASASLESVASSESAVSVCHPLNSLMDCKNKEELSTAAEEYYDQQIQNLDKIYERCVSFVKDWFSETLQSLPESYLDGLLSSRFDPAKLENLDAETEKNVGSGHHSRLSLSKEPIEFKKPKVPRRTSSRTSRKRSLSAPAARVLPPHAPEFKTPLNSTRQQLAKIGTITPKVSNTPVSVMRRPQHGEVAFSTCGSPLLIGPVSHEDIPTVSVPLQDGRIFSILPEDGLPPIDLPIFDESTKKYLKTLRDNLAMLSSSP